MRKSDLPAPTKGDTPPAKPPRISCKVEAAIEAMLDGRARSITDAAKLVDMARESLSRALAKPHVQEHVRQRTDRLLKGTTLIRAAGRLDRLIDAQSENVAFRATELALGLNGYRPPQQGTTVQANVNVGWVIDLRTNANAAGQILGDSTVGGTIIDVEQGG